MITFAGKLSQMSEPTVSRTCVVAPLKHLAGLWQLHSQSLTPLLIPALSCPVSTLFPVLGLYCVQCLQKKKNVN